MAYEYDERAVDSPLVERVWRTQSTEDGRYVAHADGCWDVLVVQTRAGRRAYLAGPTTRATPIPYREGWAYLGIRLRLGVHLPSVAPRSLVDRTTVLPPAGRAGFLLDGRAWPLPDYDSVEAFVGKLARHGLLRRDEVVEAALHDDMPWASRRTVQRHFLHSTGLTQRSIRSIERARRAVELLQQGTSIADTVHDAGFTDQPHLTNALTRLIGETPGRLSRGSTG